MEECREAIEILKDLLQVVDRRAANYATQRDILEEQNTQLRARVADYAAHIDGILAAQAVLRTDVTSQFAAIRAAQDRRFDELQQAVGRREPLWRTLVKWGAGLTALVVAAKQ